MSMNLPSDEKSNMSTHTQCNSSDSIPNKIESIPVLKEISSDNNINIPQTISNPSRFQHPRNSSMDFGKVEVKETILQQYNAHMQELQQILDQERLYLTQPGVQKMAIKIFRKQLKSKLEIKFINRLLQSMQIYEYNNTDIMSSDIVTRDLIKYFQCTFYKKHHKLFDKDQYGDKFYIILSGSVYCLVPDVEKIKNQQKIQRNYSNDIDNVQKNKNQQLFNVVKQSQHPRRNSAKMSAMNAIIDLDSSRFENKDELEKQFIEQTYPELKMAKIMQQGEAFGEIALLSEDNKRTATVVFREDSWVLSLSRSSFDHIMGNYKSFVLDDNLQFLKTFDFFKNIPDMRLLGLLHSMNTHQYDKKTVIYTEKDPSSHIFFLKNGSVEISQLQNSFEQISNSQKSLQVNNINQKIKIRRKTHSQSHNMLPIDENILKTKNKNFPSIKLLNTEGSDYDANNKLNTSLNSISEKEKQLNNFITKEKPKHQKRIAIASLGIGSYFGEDEILIHKNSKRQSQAVCQAGKTEVFSIEKKKLLDILKEYGQKERFIEDAKSRNEMREERINKLLENERESNVYTTSQRYFQKNYDQLESEKLINIPQTYDNSLYYSQKNIQTQSISSQSSTLIIPKSSIKSPTSCNNITSSQFNNTSSFTSMYQPFRRASMTFILDDVEKSEDFQKIYQKKKKIMEVKNNTKLFTMKKDQYILTINKILKEGNFNLNNDQLPHLKEKFTFQQTDHTKKSGKMNKYNIPLTSLKENQNIAQSTDTMTHNHSSRYLTPSHNNNKSSSVHISLVSPQKNIFLAKQKINSSSVFNSLLQNKQMKFEEQFFKPQLTQRKNDHSNIDSKKFFPSENIKKNLNEGIKMNIPSKSIYNFTHRVPIPLQPSSIKNSNI